MKKIPLTQGKFALVDDEDFGKLNKHKWYANNGYAKRKTLGGKLRRNTLYMHRVILDMSPSNEHVDHKDNNGFNNCRSNLRCATCSQNQANRHKLRVNTSSQFRGVYWHISAKKWISSIGYKMRLIHLGYYKIELEAAQAYDKKAKELFGEFARTNFYVELDEE